MQLDEVRIANALGGRAQEPRVSARHLSQPLGSRWKPDQVEQPSRVTLRELMSGQ
jgi:hypothetical protein